MNYHEEKASEVLNKITSKNNAHVFPKVRLADVLDVESSGLTNDEFTYALKSHFDFVITDVEFNSLFAVEFDGPHHDQDTRAAANDAKKNSICKKMGFELLRITAEFLNRKVRRFTLLAWLVDIWFIEQAFYSAQEAGDIPDDEPFLYFSIMSDSLEGKTDFPYDLSLPDRLFLLDSEKRGISLYGVPSHLTTDGIDGYYAKSIALIRLTNLNVIMGEAYCREFRLGSLGHRDLCEELATIDLAERLKGYIAGKIQAVSPKLASQKVQEFRALANRLNRSCIESGLKWD